LTSEDSAV
nr:immunoglobulin heavy chain junction region [Mus musculus]